MLIYFTTKQALCQLILSLFLFLRNNRLLLNREYVIQEIYAEELEGMAEFIGLKALKIINLDKYNNRINFLNR